MVFPPDRGTRCPTCGAGRGEPHLLKYHSDLCSKCGHSHLGRPCREIVDRLECKCWVYTAFIPAYEPRALVTNRETNQGSSGPDALTRPEG